MAGMYTFTIVTEDPTSAERSGVPEARLAEARSLGFELEGWVAATSEGITLVSAVMPHAGGDMILEVARALDFDDIVVETLFEDGGLLYTNTRPALHRWLVFRWGVGYPPEHRIVSGFFAVASIADLVAIHAKRVEAERARGRRPIASHDLRAYLAMRLRSREVSDPRMYRQEAIAKKVAVVVAAAAAALALVASMRGASPLATAFVPPIALAAGSMAGYAVGLLFVGALLARGTPAPPPRPAADLLASAERIGCGPIPDALGVASRSPAESPERRGAVVTTMSSADLARLQRVDLVATLANVLVLPVTGFMALSHVGVAGLWGVVGAVLTLDALVKLTTKKSRAELVREMAAPALVNAESLATGACALEKQHATWLMLVFGISSLFAARQELASDWHMDPASMSLPWFALSAVLFFRALGRARARHKLLVAL